MTTNDRVHLLTRCLRLEHRVALLKIQRESLAQSRVTRKAEKKEDNAMSNMDENAQLRAQLEALGSARELLAAYAHEAWGAYMGYFLDKCIVQPDGYVRSLERLIATPYTKLTEAEKDSDRAEADKMIAIVTQARLAKEQR